MPWIKQLILFIAIFMVAVLGVVVLVLELIIISNQ